MMFLLFGTCFIIFVVDNYALKDTIKKKNLDFVENLKQDLRRNNDDYAEMKRRVSKANDTLQSIEHPNYNDIRHKIITTRDSKRITKSDQSSKKINSTIYSSPKNVHEDDERIKIIDTIRRRVNDALASKELTVLDVSDPQRRANRDKEQHRSSNNTDVSLDGNSQPRLLSVWSQMHNFMQKDTVNQHRIRLFPNKNVDLLKIQSTLRTTQTSSWKPIKIITTTKKNKHMKKNKMETLKKFIQKNKGLLKEFISSKKLAERMKQATPATRPTQQTLAQTQPKISSAFDLNKITRQAAKGLILNKKSLEELPNANMLDMFPAKGGRIHSKRVKGHLCHRHVLIPEGPKYNSLGTIYLPPHAAAGIAHEYNSTDIPKLLLPRCCNCCRKSVLGCE